MVMIIHLVIVAIALEYVEFPWHLAWLDDCLWKILNQGYPENIQNYSFDSRNNFKLSWWCAGAEGYVGARRE